MARATEPTAPSGAESFSCRAAAPSIGSRRCVPFRLPGGGRAVREPRRAAFGLLHEMYGNDLSARTDVAPVAAFEAPERRLLAQMLDRGVNSPMTTSAGRLFDAVASLCGLCHQTSFEGQAAMDLEFVDRRACRGMLLDAAGQWTADVLIDWAPAIHALLDDVRDGAPVGVIALRLHTGLAAAVAEVAVRIGVPRVVLDRRLLSESLSPRTHGRAARARGLSCLLAPARADRTTAASRSVRSRWRHGWRRSRNTLTVCERRALSCVLQCQAKS